MCMNDESDTLSVTAYSLLQDILMHIIDHSWYTVVPDEGPGVLYNAIHNGVSLDTTWEQMSYSTSSLLNVSRIINEALRSVCPAQPVSPETVSALRSLKAKLASVPSPNICKLTLPLGHATFQHDIFNKLFLLSKDSYPDWFTPSSHDTSNKELSFLKEIFDILRKEHGDLNHYRDSLKQAWELVSMTINVVRAFCHGTTKELDNYDDQPNDIVSAIEKECTELYPSFFLHKLEQYLESLETRRFWLLQDNLFSYFESISVEHFISFVETRSSTLQALMTGHADGPFSDPIAEWYADFSRFSLRRCIMLCTIFVEEISMQDISSAELNDRIAKVCSKSFINEWNHYHSSSTIPSMYRSLNAILKRHPS
ncbi:hypothetical protein GSB_153468 [Giardia duodenalis]|uniref:Uncharacterized protein n=2 Tax=Giardia intestinalis TaxID=5741 RepID=C6LRH0_GIAIB|nr:Hypothetical protein GL50581_1353 [Giardia intestinalis ATCC 50581]ESU42835.1 hypothetical protein GSB_153468 [Giardia intestinalis]